MIINISVFLVSTQPLKHSKNPSKLDTSEYWAYDKLDLCIVTCVREYLSRKNNQTDHKQLILTYGKPYRSTPPDSIHWWVKEIFTDTKIYHLTPHSCQWVLTNKVMAMNVNIEDILRKDANSFYKFYYRGILYLTYDAGFQTTDFSVYTRPWIYFYYTRTFYCRKWLLSVPITRFSSMR